MRDNYDPLFQIQGAKLGIDWRLFKAMAAVESSFDEQARSKCGALGLMQVMPSTAKDCGIAIPMLLYNPLINVAIGTTYLVDTWKAIDVELRDKNEQLKAALAAYNGGAGYVNVAMRLFELDKKREPQTWIDVAEYLTSAACKVRNKRPDHQQIINYVGKVWMTYQEYCEGEKSVAPTVAQEHGERKDKSVNGERTTDNQ